MNMSMQRSRRLLLGVALPLACLVAVAGHDLAISTAALPQSDAAQDDPPRSGGTALELLPGWEASELGTAAGVVGDPLPRNSVEAAAKLAWALRRLDIHSIESRVGQGGPTQELDATSFTRIRGWARGVEAVAVPEPLADRLELQRLYRVRVDGEIGVVHVITTTVPEMWSRVEQLNEPVQVTGLAIGGSSPRVVFAPRLQWSPDAGSATSRWPEGWRLLSRRGFDCGLLAGVASRQRMPLVAEDSEAFYQVLAIAGALATAAGPAAIAPPPPQEIEVVRMLQSPADLAGEWIQVDLQIARITRVVVTSPEVREQLGRDWYWQIDAFGDLGRVRVELESSPRDAEKLVFENRFPVSAAILDLPEWLEAPMGGRGGGRVDMAMVNEDVTIRGFFYRLWSYESQFADAQGGRQVAPLILASSVQRRAAARDSVLGVGSLGWGFAAAVLVTLLAATWFVWSTGRRDRVAQRRRRSGL